MSQDQYNAVYSGGAFNSGLEKGKAFGEIHVTDREICFRTGETAIRAPVGGIQIETGGSGGNMIYLRHSKLPDWVLFTSDAAILKHPALFADLETAAMLSGIQRKRIKPYAAALIFLLLIIGAFTWLYLARDQITWRVARRIPPKWEQQFGTMLITQVNSEFTAVDDPLAMADFRRIADPVLSAIPDDRYEIELHMVESEEINAFALPGGHVVFFTGLIQAAESPEEIAGVLAHEAAHVTQMHGLRRLISSGGMYLMLQALLGNMQGILSVIADSGVFLLNRKFTRDQEREADDKAWEYLVSAGVDPKGMTSFFRRLEKHIQEKLGSKKAEEVFSYIGTHPSTRERIERLAQKTLPPGQTFSDPYADFDLQAFKDRLKNDSTGNSGLNSPGR